VKSVRWIATLLILQLLGRDDAIPAGGRSRSLRAGQPLSEALEALREEGLNLVYSSDLVRPEMLVLAEPAARSPREMAEEILAPHGLKLQEGPAGTLLVVNGTVTPDALGGISGRVRIRDTLRPVPAALILLPGTPTRIVTGRDGRFFVPDLPGGTYTLEVRVPGFRAQHFEVIVPTGAYIEKDFDVAVVPGYVERVVVSPTGGEEAPSRQAAPVETIPAEALNRMAQLGGDLQRSFVRLPGAAGGDKSASVSVRGGDRDETQLLLDGLEIDEPFHLKDFLSFSGIVDSQAVGSLKYFSGGYPAEYSGRMSGVVDLASKEPATKSAAAVNAGLVNFEALLEGATADGSRAWVAAARRWYPDAVFDLVDPGGDPIDPSYYDFFGKMEFRLDGGSLLTAHLLAAHDAVDFASDISVSDVRASTSNGYAWLTLTTPWTTRLASRTLFSAGRVNRFRDGLTESAAEGTVAVRDERDLDVATLRQDWTLETSERFRSKWGFDLRWDSASYDYTGHSEITDPLVTQGGPPVVIDRRLAAEPSGSEYGAYAAQWIRIAEPLAAEAGLRWDRQTATAEEELSPRVDLVYTPRPGIALRAAWGRFYQPQRPGELQVEDGETRFFPAQLSEHMVLSFEWLVAPRWRLRADAYRKEMSHLRPRYENLFDPIELFPEGEGDRIRIAPDSAEAKGVELLLQWKGEGRLSGWAGYTRASADDLLGGERIPRSWDQRHAFNFSLDYGGSEPWAVNLAGIYHSGWPTTEVTATQIQNPSGPPTIVPSLGPRNADRYPSYYRLDLRASRTFRKGDSTYTFYAEITNLTNRDNVCCVEEFRYLPQPGGPVTVDRVPGFWLERVPSAGFIWRYGP
jgi:TonB-dependent receptor-like protein/carboxypeptidase family protein